ncbi:MAG TPA: DUF1731 domain-containing protein [Kofleriaceae bacterium]|jgi:hypothetical protein|nr:DUF1731 domain-containing protein [Kofleriaceae bacterium]
MVDAMKIVIPGGTGHVGVLIARAFADHEIVIIGRSTPIAWDGKTLGPWAKQIEGADVVIGLAGRSVNCRYTEANRAEMLSSRVDSTRVVGEAIAAAARPPRVWLQSSTATIYAHRLDAANDEATGLIDTPTGDPAWKFSVSIAKAWEEALAAAPTPKTRKVALRSAMVMSPDRDGIFDVLYKITRRGLGGAIGGGAQYVSWIHERDFARALEWLIAHDDVEGAVNMASPHPLPQREFMAALRAAAGRRVGLPATAWMAKLGAFVMRTEAELILKSRRVVPGRLLAAGFAFEYPDWREAARDLVARRATG